MEFRNTKRKNFFGYLYSIGWPALFHESSWNHLGAKELLEGTLIAEAAIGWEGLKLDIPLMQQ